MEIVISMAFNKIITKLIILSFLLKQAYFTLVLMMKIVLELIFVDKFGVKSLFSLTMKENRLVLLIVEIF